MRSGRSAIGAFFSASSRTRRGGRYVDIALGRDDAGPARAESRAAGARGGGVLGEARRDDRDAHLALLERFVGDRAEDDLRVRIDGLGDDGGRILDLEHAQVVSAGDREEDALGSGDRDLEERRIDGGARGGFGALLADRGADTHERGACVVHDRPDVREVDVDDAGLGDEIGDSLDGLLEDVVAHGERVLDAGIAAHDREQLVVGDDDRGVDGLLELGEALIGEAHALLALESERLGDDADGERPQLAGDLRDDGRRAGAGAAAHAAGDEHHVGTLDRFLDLLARLLGGLLAEIRVHAGSEAAGEGLADVYLLLRLRFVEILRVGVDRDEVHALDVRLDHVIDSVAARAADADHPDAGERFDLCLHLLAHSADTIA